MIKSNKNSLLAVALAVGIIGFGSCSSTSTNSVSTGNNGNIAVVVNKPANANTENLNIKPINTAVATKPPPRTDETVKSEVPTGGKIGVAECDEYLAKYEACINTKVPESQRAALISPLETMRKGWKNAVTNPQAKAALAGGCKIALTTAKESMSAFSCDW